MPLIIDTFLGLFTMILMQKTQFLIGRLAKEYRERSGLTQAELSLKLGYKTAQFVSKFERGEARIPSKVLGVLIVLLGIPEKTVMKLLMDSYKDELSSQITLGKSSLGRK